MEQLKVLCDIAGVVIFCCVVYSFGCFAGWIIRLIGVCFGDCGVES